MDIERSRAKDNDKDNIKGLDDIRLVLDRSYTLQIL